MRKEKDLIQVHPAFIVFIIMGFFLVVLLNIVFGKVYINVTYAMEIKPIEVDMPQSRGSIRFDNDTYGIGISNKDIKAYEFYLTNPTIINNFNIINDGNLYQMDGPSKTSYKLRGSIYH